ncbi:MAG: DEAD/DEAH box helicase, partial [Acidobacteria bacterium]|nr:DEAD/DEAH box helicase [Acidobacteriota bacterium]
ALTAEEAARAPASLAAWSLAAKLALELVGRERIVPRVVATDAGLEACFAVALAAPEDAERVAQLAQALPPAAHALPVAAAEPAPAPPPRRRRKAAASAPAPPPAPAPAPAGPRAWAPDALLRAFLDATADVLARAANPPREAERAPRAERRPWERRLAAALTGPDPFFAPAGFEERTLLADLHAWARPALGTDARAARPCLRLELPADAGPLPLRFFLQAPDDPSLLVPAADVWRGGRRVPRLAASLQAPEEQLLRGLGTAARLFPPVGRCLDEARPEAVLLEPPEAWEFLTQAGPALAEAGLGVILPAELTPSGRRRLRLRMRVGGAATKTAGAVTGLAALGVGELVEFRWEAALGDDPLTAAELRALAKLKAPVARFRGQWVAVDPGELKQVERLLREPPPPLAAHEALAAALGGAVRRPETAAPVEVVAEGALAEVVARLRGAREPAGRHAPAAVPRGLAGTLRPYQVGGLRWLAQMAGLGLGACLADDMGLGKTIQLLAFLLHRRERAPDDARPALLVCPTSVLGNWEREIARFAPSLPVLRHYGADRRREARQLAAAPAGAIVLTTYGLLRRDAELLGGVEWSVAALDEAQNIKNAASHTARAARALRAAHRFALTGTPVENRLAELWSISEFLNPRLLGPLETFRREVAIPVERYNRDDVAERLARVVRPFVLRRLKSDPAVIRDLPAKQEMDVICTLTREQASLYQAAVDEVMREIESAQGIARRGLVLALLTALKQICNHPAQYLGEAGPLAGRSGKLARLSEMLEEVVAAGDRALVFTQYREMGDRLVAELSRRLGEDVPFLHGGVPRAKRDELVARFQDGPRAPRVFVLSLKAGGTGLNLTAANHVFHYDRWWNPAVEDQATDRAYRIGQSRAVQVHKLLCAGTVEEKINEMLAKKRALAERIVGAGEQWITELDDTALRELFALSPNAVVVTDDAGDPGAGR